MPDIATVAPLAQAASAQLGFAHWAAMSNIADVTDDEASVWPQPAGNAIAWLVGHMMFVRQAFAGAFGKERFLSPEMTELFKRGSKPTPATALPSLSELRPIFERSHAALVEVVSGLDEETLAKKAPFSPGGDPNETVGSLMLKIVVHEAYHAGQLGVVRRLVGKAGAI